MMKLMNDKFSNYIFRNQVLDKKQLQNLMLWVFNNYGSTNASFFGDYLKKLGFAYATKAGLSISIEDLKITPDKRTLVKQINSEVMDLKVKTKRGEITILENFQAIINKWNEASEFLKDNLIEYFKTADPLNSVYIMAFSGARGNMSQVRQLVGMRGLMSDPSGRVIAQPIKKNFREGLSVTDYIVSSYGARKGLVDTALKTADSGYLTRRLVDVVQDIMIRESNCLTKRGLQISKSFDENLLGRVLARDLINYQTQIVLARKDDVISSELIKKYNKISTDKIVIRSPLICETDRSICQICYGWNLAYSSIVDLGEAIGIIAAQSIGEPGTQLTMRTFHTGGVFVGKVDAQLRSSLTGNVYYSKDLETKLVRTKSGLLAERVSTEGYLALVSDDGQLKHKVNLEVGTQFFTPYRDKVTLNQLLIQISNESKSKKKGNLKPLRIPISGEVFCENLYLKDIRNETELAIKKRKYDYVMWLLYGQVYSVPNSFNLLTQKTSTFYKNTSLAQSKLITRNEGFIDFWQNDLYRDNKTLSITTKYFFSKPLYCHKVAESQNLHSFLLLNKLVFVNFKKSFQFVNIFKTRGLVKQKYKTFTGGHFYNLLKNKNKGGTILWLPQELKVLMVNKFTFPKKLNRIYGKKKFFTKNLHFKINGLLFVRKKLNSTSQINLHVLPGNLIYVRNNFDVQKYKNRIYFPGEILWNKIFIKEVTLVKIITDTGSNSKKVLLCPLYQFKIPNSEFSSNFENNKKFWKTKINVFSTIKVKSKFNVFQQSTNNCDLIYSKLECSSQYNFLGYKSTIFNNKIKILISAKTNEIVGIKNQFILSSNSYSPKEISKRQLNSRILLNKNQYVEPYTVLSFYNLLTRKNFEAKYLRNSIKDQRKVLIVRKEDYKKYHNKQDNYENAFFRPFIRQRDKVMKYTICPFSGKVDSINPFEISYHLGQSLIFASTDMNFIKHGELLEKHTTIGFFNYTTRKTSDIVQGLPKVEEVLEARKPYNIKTKLRISRAEEEIEQSKIDRQLWRIKTIDDKDLPEFPKRILDTPILPGVIIEQNYILDKVNYKKSDRLKYELRFLTKNKHNSLPYWFPIIYPKRYPKLNKKYSFKNIGSLFLPAKRNPHIILNSLFLYYSHCDFLSLIDAIHRSCIKVQVLLVNLVQEVYQGQGVNISSKHIELIVKRMTSKVKITNGNDSGLLPGEDVDIRQIEVIEKSILNTANNPPKYYPILMGITRTSLKTDSFISAASFQETVRVLTKAAIEGQMDWLHGLKENVIVGRLIPVGTGYNNYLDFSPSVVGIPDMDKTLNRVFLVDKENEEEKKKKTLPSEQNQNTNFIGTLKINKIK
uniref:DNA-directed RNA polymerase n=1 Tax=Olisthodiscus luteus TaxID=83000 RepID=A0A7U0KSM7_OLILU|nr:RNA polymerase b'' subunit [Olisthodiscus luteus]QQW50522.1 RNA polymerase b'' subunit [Olisthodiscus luteus]